MNAVKHWETEIMNEFTVESVEHKRKLAGLTQERIAALIGTSRRSYNEWVNSNGAKPLPYRAEVNLMRWNESGEVNRDVVNLAEERIASALDSMAAMFRAQDLSTAAKLRSVRFSLRALNELLVELSHSDKADDSGA